MQYLKRVWPLSKHLISLLLAVVLTVHQFDVQILRCYDGDTCTADIDMGLDVWVHGERLRLAEIDAPEMRGAEKVEGRRSRNHLLHLIKKHSPVRISTTGERGKYGRLIARILGADGVDLNEQMVLDGFAEHKQY